MLRILLRLWLFGLWAMVFVFQWILHGSDLAARKLFRYETKSQFVRQGRCERSGFCCQTLGIELPETWVTKPWVVALFQRWYALVHNFQPAGPPQGRLLPFSCGYFRNGDTCAVYPYRPKLCREFPQTSLFGAVELHRGCGFWFVERSKLGGFEASLAREKHEAERRDVLRNTEED